MTCPYMRAPEETAGRGFREDGAEAVAMADAPFSSPVGRKKRMRSLRRKKLGNTRVQQECRRRAGRSE